MTLQHGRYWCHDVAFKVKRITVGNAAIGGCSEWNCLSVDVCNTTHYTCANHNMEFSVQGRQWTRKRFA